jgi:chemotaxis protein MotB
MRDKEQQEPIIIVKKRGGHGGGHHGGSWKVAYADFTTSMMAFFLVMWLVNQAPAVREAVSGYFKDPTGFKKGGSSSVLPKEGSSVIEMKARNSMVKEMDRKQMEREARKQLAKAAAEIVNALKQDPNFSTLKNQIEVQMTAEGLRIQLLDSSGETFFERGSAELKPNTKLLLSVIAQQVGKLTNTLIIEGHTDSFQYAQLANYTNWELSADRCNSARRYLAANGLRLDQVREVRGFADTEPRIKGNPTDPRNRRIAIIVVNDFSGLNYLDKNVILKEEDIAGENGVNQPPDRQSPSDDRNEASTARGEQPQAATTGSE